MTDEPLSFFTIDHGTATTAVTLVAPLAGRFRLLAAGAAPRGTDLDALLGDLVERVVANEPGLLPAPEGWRDWARLEAGTRPPPRIYLLAASERRAAELERAFGGAGWDVVGHGVAGKTDQLAMAELCLDPSVVAIALAAGEPPAQEERGNLPMITALAASIASRRPDLWVVLSGGAAAASGSFPQDRLVTALAPAGTPSAVESPLRETARALATHIVSYDGGPSLPDVRAGLRTAVGTMAELLDRRIGSVEIGHSAGSRTLAAPAGEDLHLVTTDGALVPASVLRNDREIDAILRWSAMRADPFSLVDRIRNLRLAPWRDAGGDGQRLRLAALRAALARLDHAWTVPQAADGQTPVAPPDLLIATGGGFAAVPPPAAALALLDALRRPGTMALFHDHARLLGPIGTLPDAADRRRLLADLVDDALLPLGSAIVAGELRAGRHPGTLRVASDVQRSELELTPGVLRLVDLPPGISARVELEARDGSLMGVRARHVALEVTGGLGGLLVDTREVPLRLPERAERRRALIESWERPVWAAEGSD